jgi:hypothetical protein
MANIKLTNFYSGQQFDDRLPTSSGYSYSENFKLDDLTKLRATYSKVSDTFDSERTFNLMADDAGVVWRLGNDDGGSNRPNNASIDNYTTGWENANTELSGAITTIEKTMTFYKGDMYFQGLNYLMKFTPPASAINLTFQATTNVVIGRGVVGKDDVLYFPTANSLNSLNVTTWTEDVITVPDDYTIKQIDVFQNLLAIGVDSNDSRESGIFLWDYINADITDFIPVGSGDLFGLANLNGILVIGLRYTDKSGQIIEMKGYSGGNPVSLGKIKMDTLSSPEPFKEFQGKIMFSSKIASNKFGIWEFGQVTNGTPYAFNLFMTDDDWAQDLYDFHQLEDGFLVAYRGASPDNDYKIDKIYTSTSDALVETQWFTGDDPTEEQELVSVTVGHSPIPSGATLTISAKVDADASYTTLIADTTEDSLRTTATFESDGSALDHFLRLKIKVEISGGNVDIYAIKPEFRVVKTDAYGG